VEVPQLSVAQIRTAIDRTLYALEHTDSQNDSVAAAASVIRAWVERLELHAEQHIATAVAWPKVLFQVVRERYEYYHGRVAAHEFCEDLHRHLGVAQLPPDERVTPPLGVPVTRPPEDLGQGRGCAGG
jgi:hypothetical protein